MSLTDFVSFTRVVEAGSFAEAARRAGTTTSAISKSLGRLEQAHGVRLLHRTTHAVSLTLEGEQVLGDVYSLLRQAERLEDLLADVGAGGASGRVLVSAPSAFARACLVPLLPRMMAEHPRLDIELRLQDGLANLGTEGIDIAIRSGPLDGLPGHVVRRLTTFPWILCASPDYLRRRGTPRTVADLAAHDQIGFRNGASGQILTWRFHDPAEDGNATSLRHAPRGRLIFDDGAAGWAMVRAGLGISWAPTWLGLDDLRDGNVVEIMPDWRVEETPLSAIRLSQRLTPPRTAAVLEFLAKAAPGWGVAGPAT